MSRHTYHRIDGNQEAITRALLKVGATVKSLSAVGGGCPDLLVGYRGTSFLLEVKDGSAVTPAQMLFISRWNGGSLRVVSSVEEALLAIGAIAEPSQPTEFNQRKGAA